MADLFDSRSSYVAVPSPINPAVVQSPSSRDLNAIGSEFLSETGGPTAATSLIRRDISAKIFDAVPDKYKIFRLLFDKPVQYKDSNVFTYMEKTFGRTAIKATATTNAGATSAISVTSGTEVYATPGKIIVFPDNTKAIVATTSAGTVNVRKLTSSSANLPAVAVNDYFSIQGSLIADGMNFLMHYDRMSKVERYNYIQMMERDKRWTRLEIQKFANLGTTDYFALDKQEQLQLLLQDMFCSFWNGQRGEAEVIIPGSTGPLYYKALTMGGIYPLMVAASCANSSGVTSATLKEVFEALCFQTNYKSDGGVRFIFAQDALLYELSKSFKEVGLRYAPNDKIADLNLTEYRIGSMRFVPVGTELFKEISMFPATWKNRIFVLDLDTIQPVCMKGYQPIETGETNPKGVNGSIQDYTEWWIQGNLSLQFNNPLSSFYIDTTGIVS
jgi:hypothetical protein